ncbi:RagB/SusD family nutrient uptake outer membrane protein [Chitinophaga silvisoli]|uniref:RagB/SusD family nutrient uptake outer membrane protein n=1 Tax=Chitinophaga silvisoli TaxID=2291814 RepID=A0A3E1P160_9BACT|nr:RagB/SusD family nutrient uptake outer membrane protein [Chitinophaga silvisoli]RFM33923.1 RagB/SusD family nutrient uptake outer membrane protein [Chitinophaga silvisoli]
MKYIIAIFCISILAACNKDFLDTAPISNQNESSFYKTENDIVQAVSGVYNKLLTFPDVNNLYLSEVRSNNYYVDRQDAARDYFSLSAFEITSALGTLQTAWTNDYEMIERANQVLDRIDEISFTDTTKRSRMKGECKFLRALAYFELVKAFGAVPLIEHTVSSEEALSYPRVGADTIYNFIVSELTAAASLLPNSYSGTDKGRATKLAALGILGRAYMFMAGYPFNKTENYSNAIQVFRQVLDAENNGWTFAPTYAEIFKTSSDNKYYLFEVQYLSGGKGLGNPVPGEVIPLDMDTKITPYGAYYMQGVPSDDLINSFEAGDKREFVILDTVYRNKSGVMTQRSYFKKYLDSSAAASILSSSDWGINFPILRPEDVMLMYAQAVNETSGPTAEALSIVNRIRTRAGLTGISGVSQSEFRLILETERRHELAWEGIYWGDLIRTGRCLDVMNPWLQTNYSKSIDVTQELYPVPQSEMQIKPGLYYQNPGYQ